jgi:membrane protease YdiL (CAAX protease family)
MTHQPFTLYKTIFISIILWFLIWTVTQGIFMSERLLQLPIDANISYAIATVWVLAVAAVALRLLPKYRRESLPKSRLLWLYAVPVALLVFLPWHYALALDIWVYVPMIVITVFWQDYVTFGLLQTRLAKTITATKAAIVTAIVFLLGHAVFFLNDITDPQFILIAIAGFGFAFLRRYTGNIYIANVIHLTFYLL